MEIIKEYIVPIADNERDYDEMFIGTIRKREMLVRCGECKYWSGDGYYCEYDMCGHSDDFCSWGKRRVDETNRC